MRFSSEEVETEFLQEKLPPLVEKVLVCVVYCDTVLDFEFLSPLRLMPLSRSTV